MINSGKESREESSGMGNSYYEGKSILIKSNGDKILQNIDGSRVIVHQSGEKVFYDNRGKIIQSTEFSNEHESTFDIPLNIKGSLL